MHVMEECGSWLNVYVQYVCVYVCVYHESIVSSVRLQQSVGIHHLLFTAKINKIHVMDSRYLQNFNLKRILKT